MLECVRHHYVRKWKYIMRFEIRYFFLEIGLSPNGMVAHALTYWPNVGPSLPQPPNLTSLRKLKYTSARTNVTHASIVAHAT